MRAEELRIGNLVYYHIVDKLNEPEEWDAENIVDCFDIAQMVENPESNEYKPIPLTEEWLLKLGFECWFEGKERCVYVLHNAIDGTSDFEVTLESNKAYPSIDENACYWGKGFYVHTLQNLYFALTGKELAL